MNAVREVFQLLRDDDDEWALPEGRLAELLLVLVGLPWIGVHVHLGPGLPSLEGHGAVVAGGAVAGTLATASRRSAVTNRFAGWSTVRRLLTVVGGTLLFPTADLVRSWDPVVVFLLVFGGTILLIYLARLVSPFHDGLEGTKRAVDPPETLGIHD